MRQYVEIRYIEQIRYNELTPDLQKMAQILDVVGLNNQYGTADVHKILFNMMGSTIRFTLSYLKDGSTNKELKQLEQVIGKRKLIKLSEHYRTGRVRVPYMAMFRTFIARYIKENYKDGKTQKMIAFELGISENYIQAINRENKWN